MASGVTIGSDGEARKPAATEIHDLLRDRICLLEYRPGAMLRENDIAGEFNVSRTPVREALQRLSIEGLVEVRNGIGTFVTTLDQEQLREVFGIRVEMSRLFGRIDTREVTAADVAILEALLTRSRVLMDKFDVHEHWRINHRLHFAISDLVLNKTFLEMWHNLYFRAARVWYDVSRDIWPEAVGLLQLEINDLLTAARENDIEAIGYVKRNYINFCWKRIASRQRS
ncbi:DNA-binding GntR family transcriptional regulator [Sinorhizobium kostiense]|uniref:DNA-binding GntR family transcriptional regulator n=1 Tax=Sinorhizobium kostiense TaxID=76747 RepID=A0ABS4R2P8_9HYPH|nr:GntR family transcriptional regulator [Sinorhizobium kostiense]MBP2236117.1 DNA-binding GntR family transcriptional regulator [Sinorhizobium kostiense]